jgi:hypothetical protein
MVRHVIDTPTCPCPGCTGAAAARKSAEAGGGSDYLRAVANARRRGNR